MGGRIIGWGNCNRKRGLVNGRIGAADQEEIGWSIWSRTVQIDDVWALGFGLIGVQKVT